MKSAPTCPRCGAPVQEPGPWSSEWRCATHGAVFPMWQVERTGAEALDLLRSRAKVPVWLLWPPPSGWLAAGIARAGDERSGDRAVAVGYSGPAPLGGAGEMLLVAEEPGVGLGAGYAGLPGPDPGDGFDAGPAPARVSAGGRPTPLWLIDGGDDLAVYVGEAMGLWLWAILWPASAGLLLAEDLAVVDARDLAPQVDVPFGARSPRLALAPPSGR